MGLLPSPAQTAATLDDLPTALKTGVQKGISTAAADVTSPTNLVTKPLAELRATAGIVTGALPTSALTSSSRLVTAATTTGSTKPVTPAAAITNDVKKVAGNVSSTVGGLTKSVQKAVNSASGSHSKK